MRKVLLGMRPRSAAIEGRCHIKSTCACRLWSAFGRFLDFSAWRTGGRCYWARLLGSPLQSAVLPFSECLPIERRLLFLRVGVIWPLVRSLLGVVEVTGKKNQRPCRRTVATYLNTAEQGGVHIFCRPVVNLKGEHQIQKVQAWRRHFSTRLHQRRVRPCSITICVV